MLLEKAHKEYGFKQKEGFTVPCEVERSRCGSLSAVSQLQLLVSQLLELLVFDKARQSASCVLFFVELGFIAT